MRTDIELTVEGPANTTIRELRPEDGPAVERLTEACMDSGTVNFTRQFIEDPMTCYECHKHDHAGVAVEGPDGKLVGMSLLTLHEAEYKGRLRDAVYYAEAQVHPDFRGKGIAKNGAKTLADIGRRYVGEDGIIYSHIQEGNGASKHIAENAFASQMGWSILEPWIPVQQSQSDSGPYDIREATGDEHELFATKANQFYSDYTLYEPLSADSLEALETDTPLSEPTRRQFVAIGESGDPVAGVTAFESYRLRALQLESISGPSVPPDGTVRLVHLFTPWWVGDNEEALAAIVEFLRAHYQNDATHLLIRIDERSAVTDALPLEEASLTTRSIVGMAPPEPLAEDRLLAVVL